MKEELKKELNSDIEYWNKSQTIERALIVLFTLPLLPFITVCMIVYYIGLVFYKGYTSTISPFWVGLNLILYFSFILSMYPSLTLGLSLFLLALPAIQIVAISCSKRQDLSRMPSIVLMIVIMVECTILPFLLPVTHSFFVFLCIFATCIFLNMCGMGIQDYKLKVEQEKRDAIEAEKEKREAEKEKARNYRAFAPPTHNPKEM